jgi:thimet oligopeptidase
LHHFLELLQRSGLALPENERKNMQQLNKEIEQLCLDFERNIAASSEKAAVTKDELAGLSDDFINSLERSADGLYLLGTDYPTMNQVLGHCTAESTREKLWVLFENRGYPANEAVLRQLVEKRNQLAAMLDFKDFAHFDLDNQMAHTPETAEQFLATLSERSAAKAQQEVAQLTAELPPSVTLTDEGKLKQWSTAFLQNSYKKKHFNIDERELSSYFPLENTIQQLLAVYKKFMSLDFEEIKPKGLWHEEVRTLKVYNKDRSFFYGYLFLDLHPRPFKFTHAAQFDLIKAFECEKTGLEIPAVAAVVANFPRAQGDKPALLMRQDATTFFHEFGHALHTMLGITHFARLSGTGVKSDFVELPSQILEEWLYDPAILRMVSKHYQTGEPLPDDIIEKIIGLKKLSTGLWTQRQIFFAIYSLRIFGANAPDPADLMEQIFGTYFKHHAYDARSHFYDSFGHLTGYGAKYYGYLWSKVFALDVFNEIKNEDGLLSPIVGKRYVDAIIRKGGTKDPNELLFDFLHRKPTIDAFLKDMGL